MAPALAITRRRLLALLAAITAIRPVRSVAAALPTGEPRLIIVNGWILRESDLAQAGLDAPSAETARAHAC